MKLCIPARSCVVLAGLIASCASTAGIQEPETSFASRQDSAVYGKLFGGVSQALDLDLSTNYIGPSSIDAEAALASGYQAGFGVGYYLGDGLAAELEYSYRSNEIDDVTAQVGGGGEVVASEGSVDVRAIMCNLIYRLDRPWHFVPYAGLGVGYVHKIESTFEGIGEGTPGGYDSDAFAAQLILGTSTSVSQHLGAFVEWRAFRAYSPSTDFVRGRGELQEDYQSWSLLLGIEHGF